MTRIHIEHVELMACGCYVWPMAIGMGGRCGRCGFAANLWVESENDSDIYARPLPGHRRIK